MNVAHRLAPHETGRRMQRNCTRCFTLAGRVRHYFCPGCERMVPWCNGAADELGELCDECAADVTAARGDEEDESKGAEVSNDLDTHIRQARSYWAANDMRPAFRELLNAVECLAHPAPPPSPSEENGGEGAGDEELRAFLAEKAPELLAEFDART